MADTQQAFDRLTDLVVILDQDGLITYGNQAFQRTAEADWTGHRPPFPVAEGRLTMAWPGVAEDAPIDWNIHQDGDDLILVGRLPAHSTSLLDLAQITHELRTPLNGILGMTHLLANSGLAPEQQRHIEVVAESGQLLLSLTNDILELSRLTAQGVTLSEDEIDPSAMAHSIATLLYPHAARQGLDIALHVSKNVPEKVKGDTNRLRQMIMNLVGNAIKFTANGGVLIELDGERQANGQRLLTIKVKDTGIGIPASDLSRIFEDFTQSHSGLHRNTTGTGLGLAIVRRLAIAMGGGIDVESSVGVGSTFTLSLPLAPVETPSGEQAPLLTLPPVTILTRSHAVEMLVERGLSDHGQGTVRTCRDLSEALTHMTDSQVHLLIDDQHSPELEDIPMALHHRVVVLTSGTIRARWTGPIRTLSRPLSMSQLAALLTSSPEVGSEPSPCEPSPCEGRALRVLLAEDNHINALVLQAYLEPLGHHLQKVPNGQAAVQAIKTGAYDFVLMDINMPVMDGLSATKAIREFADPDLPIIGLTAAGEPVRADGLAAGMNDMLTKPLTQDALALMLDKWCGRKIPAKFKAA